MKKIIVLCLLLGAVYGGYAQDFVTDFLETNKGAKVFTQVNVSAKMFQMISEITDAETESIIDHLTGMKILTTEQETEHYFREAQAMIQKNNTDYEELMSICEEGEEIRMYIREKNKTITELVILVGGKGEFMLMNFCGIIDLKKISKLSKAVNIEGIEYLDKVKK